MKKETDIRYTKIWKIKEQEEEQVNKDHISEITRLVIVRERQGNQAKEEWVSRTIWSESTSEQDHNKEKLKKEQVPEIIGFAVARERKEE
jgi:hypothetical protein